ncbi:hypothetical protein GGP41_007521 [Bipolaris sorokiniana]|uniref:Uncharacterized protein n=1 Tax=Cochliobolus sativus TaxID=45130 RepID=A0A8H5Z6M7_COCSA|nr:hypothetical protein GGP41_007521 [Bipolaris sorokiniana]
MQHQHPRPCLLRRREEKKGTKERKKCLLAVTATASTAGAGALVGLGRPSESRWMRTSTREQRAHQQDDDITSHRAASPIASQPSMSAAVACSPASSWLSDAPAPPSWCSSTPWPADVLLHPDPSAPRLQPNARASQSPGVARRCILRLPLSALLLPILPCFPLPLCAFESSHHALSGYGQALLRPLCKLPPLTGCLHRLSHSCSCCCSCSCSCSCSYVDTTIRPWPRPTG